VESRLTRRFRDGSLQDELVTRLQRPVLTLLPDKQIQRAPSFSRRRRGRVHARAESVLGQAAEAGPERHGGISETLKLPPRLVKTIIQAVGEDPIIVGDACRSATRYLVDLEVVGIAGIFATIAGKEPPDQKFWMLCGSLPTFVKFEGPLFVTVVPACSASPGAGVPRCVYAAMF